MRPIPCVIWAALLLLGATPEVPAAEPVVLVDLFAPGTTSVVECRVNLSGELQVPVDEKGGTKRVAMKGESSIRYDERILPPDPQGKELKSLRLYRQMEFDRKVGDVPQAAALRREVSRLVVVKSAGAKMAFSPDGPLTWGELDLLRTDLFLPALAGMLPGKPVKPGDRWPVGAAALQELTDMEVEAGGVEATFIEETSLGNARLAHVKFSGQVRGVNEDGPARHTLTGTLYFDLDRHFISYLSIRGEQQLLDPKGQVNGTVEGVCVLTRRLKSDHPDLRPEAVASLKLEPSDENTQLLYENPDLGVRFRHPRRWRVGRVQGRQITLDETKGNGILITVEPQRLVPATEAYLKESREGLAAKGARFGKAEAPQRLQREPGELDRFGFEVEVGGERAWMDYFVARQPLGGVCIAARLTAADRDGMRQEVERIARSLVVLQRLETK